MVTYNADDVTKWFTPRSGLVRRMKTVSFDIALDLNAQFSLVSAFLCKASRAPLRMSFAKERGERFFNVQFQSKVNNKQPRQYQGFVHCLQMFDRS
jgi:ADP-heptose:LPS heptosyltransferase